jgi:hypothetical protein
VNVGVTCDELVAHLITAGELLVSGDDQAATDSYFDMQQYRFHGPDGFEADYSGLTNYFKAIRAAFDDRSIRRGIVVAEGDYVACQTWIEGTFVREFTVTSGLAKTEWATRGLGPVEHFPVRRPGVARRRVGTDGLQEFSSSTRGAGKIVVSTAWLPLRRRVDEDVERRQLTVLHYTNVSASHPLRVSGRSIGPRKATDAMYRLPWPTGREHIAFKLREKELSSGVDLFDALMNAAWIDKDAILIPQFVDCRATAVGVSSVEDLQQVPVNDLLD